MSVRAVFIACFSLLFLTIEASAIERPARQLFGYKIGPAEMKARAIGSYARGCMAGGVKLPVSGPAWQAMRLSRNRNWGLPVLVDYVETLATEAKQKDGWSGLLVGDMAQPRGGPMLTGHASHQIGLDADIWLLAMPNYKMSRRERENRTAISVLDRTRLKVDPKKWTLGHTRLIRRAASYRQVARIFVHPAIKQVLCDTADKVGEDRGWLRRVRPWYGHHYHFHVRLKCPAGMRGCKNQKEPPVSDGCGKELAGWHARLRPKKVKKPIKPKKKVVKKRRKKRELTLAGLPAACTTVLAKGDPGDLKRLGYGVIGDIPVPTRNPRRGAVQKALAPAEIETTAATAQ